MIGRIAASQGPPGRSGARKPEPWAVEALALIAEQQAIPFDQMARFLRCEEADAAQIAIHLSDSGYAECARLLVGEPPWIWLTAAGTKGSGTGFSKYLLRVAAMPRMRAVNEVRLFLARRLPQGRWISHRALLCESGVKGPKPNGVATVGCERHAIMVKLGAQVPEREATPIEAHLARYDAVVIFAKPDPRRLIERLRIERHWTRKVIVRDIPTADSP